jgi:class 3 adenylate cyclase
MNYLYNFFIEKYSLKNVYNLDLTKLEWCIEKISLEESINVERYKSTSCNTKIHQFPVNVSKVLKLPADNQLYSVVLWTKLPDSFNLNKLNHPAIFTSSIGEFSTLYLNDHLLLNKGILSKKYQFTKYRNEVKKLLIPLPKNYIEKENYLILHLIGYSPVSYIYPNDHFGLYSSQGYLIGEFDVLLLKLKEYYDLFSLGIFFFISVFYLIQLYIEKKVIKSYLFFALFSMNLFLYYLTKTSMIFSAIENTYYITWWERFSLLTTLIFMLLFLHYFFYEEVQKKLNRLTTIFLIFFTILVLLKILLPYAYSGIILRVWQLSVFPAILYIFWFLYNAYRQKLPFSQYFLFLYIVLFASVIFDILDAMIFRTGVIISSYLFTIFIFVLSLIQISKLELIIKESIELERKNQQIIDVIFKFYPRKLLSILNIDLKNEHRLKLINLNTGIIFIQLIEYKQLLKKFEAQEITEIQQHFFRSIIPSIDFLEGEVLSIDGDRFYITIVTKKLDVDFSELVHNIYLSLPIFFENFRKFNVYFYEKYYEKYKINKLHVEIACNVSQLTAGLIGSDEQHKVTIIGDAVNVAARILELIHYKENFVYVTEHFFNCLYPEEKNHFRYIGKYLLRGKEEFISLFEDLRFDPEFVKEKKRRLAPYLVKAIECYYQYDLNNAVYYLKKAHTIYEEDPIVNTFLSTLGEVYEAKF